MRTVVSMFEHHIASCRHRVLAAALLTLVASFALASHAAPLPRTPGTLANPGFEGQPMKSMFFFPGQWRGVVGEAFYAGPNPGAPPLAPATNAFCLYTVLPVDGWMNLGWSDNVGGEKREHAVELMLAAGVNVVNMSYWGPPNVDRWAFWAPMHTAPRANEELFDQAVGKPVLIAPYIEDGASTQDSQQRGCHGDAGPIGQSPAYRFADTFPGTAADPRAATRRADRRPDRSIPAATEERGVAREVGTDVRPRRQAALCRLADSCGIQSGRRNG